MNQDLNRCVSPLINVTCILIGQAIYMPRHASMHVLSNKMNNDRADGHCYLMEVKIKNLKSID